MADLTKTNHGYHTRPKSILISTKATPEGEKINEVNSVYHKLDKIYKSINEAVGDEVEVKIDDLIVKNLSEFYVIYGLREQKKQDELKEASNLLQVIRKKQLKK